jgi:hypothetical protein
MWLKMVADRRASAVGVEVPVRRSEACIVPAIGKNASVAEFEEEKLEGTHSLFQSRVESQDAEHPGYASAWVNFQEVLLVT